MKNQTLKSGFTIIELLVTFSIYIIISAIVIANYRGYSTNALSANAPEDVVLALRQAQVYGAVGRGCGLVPSFDCRYGVVFTTTSGSEKGFTLFVDSNDNKVYDDISEKIETLTWSDPSVITKVECLPAITEPSCSNGILNITFKRPSPDALINDTADMTGFTSGGYERGRVTVSNGLSGGSAKTKIITISQAGQISIQ